MPLSTYLRTTKTWFLILRVREKEKGQSIWNYKRMRISTAERHQLLDVSQQSTPKLLPPLLERLAHFWVFSLYTFLLPGVILKPCFRMKVLRQVTSEPPDQNQSMWEESHGGGSYSLGAALKAWEYCAQPLAESKNFMSLTLGPKCLLFPSLPSALTSACSPSDSQSLISIAPN
jgi:hypothetical protein